MGYKLEFVPYGGLKLFKKSKKIDFRDFRPDLAQSWRGRKFRILGSFLGIFGGSLPPVFWCKKVPKLGVNRGKMVGILQKFAKICKKTPFGAISCRA